MFAFVNLSSVAKTLHTEKSVENDNACIRQKKPIVYESSILQQIIRDVYFMVSHDTGCATPSGIPLKAGLSRFTTG